MLKFFCIAAGGALGAVARYGVSGWVQNAAPATFPWGTLCVNAVGSMLIGVFLGISELTPVSSALRLLFAVGFLGAFTTFSTYSLETLNMFRDKETMLGLMKYWAEQLALALGCFRGVSPVAFGRNFY